MSDKDSAKFKTLISSILPNEIESAEAFGHVQSVQLFPEEFASICNAVEKRQREFSSGRLCARNALRKLGYPKLAIPVGLNREPVWPTGIAGSITHCEGYVAAAISCASTIASLGIDAELHVSLHEGILDLVANPEERAALSRLPKGNIHWDKILFSAKESIFKAWYPLNQTWLDFKDATIRIASHSNDFTAQICSPSSLQGGSAAYISGRYKIVEPFVLTSAVIQHGDTIPVIEEVGRCFRPAHY